MAVGGGVLASLISRKMWPVLATSAVAFGMWLLYVHASRRGLARNGQETESY